MAGTYLIISVYSISQSNGRRSRNGNIPGGKRLYNSRISCIRQSDFENKAEIS